MNTLINAEPVIGKWLFFVGEWCVDADGSFWSRVAGWGDDLTESIDLSE